MSTASKLQQPDAGAKKSARELIDSPDFKALVKKRWTVSFSLLAVLFVGYYGYILVVATNKEWVASTVSSEPGAVVTVGIPLGIGAIVLAWVLTAIYVWWANAVYDPEVQRLKDQLKH
ncbi:MAG: DUF485 domain-containing protein [Anaeromyxobacter sp.]|nr:DUF485 domain-containing protein [Anaeromyxobacter sp.]MBL0275703.1 DUF485 domain-containing protein [Anaeromyxobacter sp.]